MSTWYTFNAAFWFTGAVEADEQPANSTHLAPPIDYTGTEPYEPRAIWRGWGWEVEPYYEPPEPGLPDRRITKLAFRNRFGRDTKIDIEMAALDDPSLTWEQRRAAAGVRVDLADQRDAEHIDLDRAETRAGVEYLEATGLIGAGRAAEILDAPIQEHERFKGP